MFTVKLDGLDIYTSDLNNTLINPKVKNELNSAGSFEFTMPARHVHYDNIKIMLSTIDVYEDDILLFTGRPTEIEIDFLQQKKVYCEGAFAYFNDSIQRPYEYDQTNISTFLTSLITNHNAQVSQNRQISVGTINIPTARTIYRKTNYETTKDCISEMCLDTNGGYMSIRKEFGVNYLDWYSDLSDISNQPVVYGINLLDLIQNRTIENIFSRIIPLGENDENDEPITIKSVNSGLDYLDISVAGITPIPFSDYYGIIEKTVKFDDIYTATDLKTAAEAYIAQLIPDSVSIECEAADLHYTDSTQYAPFKVGQLVTVASTPHGISASFPITKIEIDLTTAAKTINIGTPPARTLTEITKY